SPTPYYGGGGGIRLFRAGTLNFFNCTITGNSAARGSGLLFDLGDKSFVVKLHSTIVSGNAFSGKDVYYLPGSTAQLTISGSNNFVGTTAGNITFDGANQFGINPLVGSLAFNGGPTPTCAVGPGSPCYNTGSNLINIATDQRGMGFSRVCGGQSEIGAY